MSTARRSAQRMKQSDHDASSLANAGEQLRYAREIIALECASARAIGRATRRRLSTAVRLLFDCSGSVITTGMGKAGLIAQKIAATLASTGTRSHFLHPAEAVHGDLGRIRADDVVLAFSQSGETEEVVRLLPSLADFGVQADCNHRSGD